MKKDIYSGISFSLSDTSTSSISNMTEKIVNFVAQIVVVMLLSFGGVFTFTTMMGVKMYNVPIFITIAAFSIIFVLAFKFTKRFHWLIILISFVVLGLVSLVLFSRTVSGAKELYNECAKAVYNAAYWSEYKDIIKWQESFRVDCTLLIAYLSVIVTCICAYFTAARIHFLGVLIVTFPLFEVGAAFGCVPNHFCFALLLAGWCASLVFHIANRQKSTVKHKAGDKSITKKEFTYKQRNGRFGGSALTMAVAVLLIFASVTTVLNGVGFSRSSATNQMRTSIKEYVLDKYDLITGYDHDGSLREGKLYNVGDRNIKNRHYITAKVPDTGNEDIYLTGFVGSVYTGDEWVDIDSEKYSQIKSFQKYLKDKGFSVATLTGDALTTYENSSNLKSGTFTLNEFRRKKDYSYLSNGACMSAGYSQISDISTKAPDNSNYSYDAFYSYADLFKVSYSLLFTTPSFQTEYNKYIKFVQDNYTLLPSGIDDVARLANELKSDSSTIYELVDKVRDFLAENDEYDNYVAKMRDEDEFTSYFVYDLQKGYSAHYATAAATMLRALGVPTRYCEGYYISSAQLKKDGVVVGDNQLQLEITDSNAHAWIEVFDSNYGWVPVEVTEGFYNTSMQDIVKNGKKQAKRDFDKANQNQEEKDDKTDKPDDSQAVSDNPESEQEIEQPETQEDKANKKVTVEAKTIIPIVLAIVLAVLIIGFILFMIIRRLVVLNRREKIFNSDDYRLQVALGFEIFIKLLKYRGIDVDLMNSYEQLYQAVVSSGLVDEDKLFNVIEIYKQAIFSHNYISDEQAATVLDFIDGFGETVYKEISLLSRLKFKFISNIA